MGHNLYEIRNGKSRQLTTFNRETKEKVFTVKAGKKCSIAKSDHPGIITRMWMTIPRWFWAHWEPKNEVDPTILKKLIIRIYWDGQSEPSVEAPFGDFFGIGHCEYRHYMSKYIGMSSGGFYSYFPMPYEKVHIEIENLHDSIDLPVFFNANVQEDELPINAGRFHAQFLTDRNKGSDPQLLVDVKGRGHFIGCSISMQGKDMNYL